MDTRVKDRTEEEILKLFDAAKAMEPGSEEHVNTIAEIEKLLKQVNDDDRRIDEAADKSDRLMEDIKRNDIQLKVDRKGRIIGFVIEGLEIGVSVLGIFAYGKWLKDGYKYEKDGIIASSWVRQLVNKAKPKP